MIKKLLFILLWPGYFFCQDFPARPSNYVTDGAGVLGPDEEHRLNSVLKTFEDSSSIQLFIYTSPSLDGAVMADLSQKIFHEWKIGNKKTNNGVLVVVFVKDHKFRIHTGYGMEGILPDLRTKRIQDEIMAPYFRENNYFMGLVEGVNKIIYYSKHEYKPVKEVVGMNWKNVAIIWVVNIVLLIAFFFVRSTRMRSWDDARNTKKILTTLAVIFALIPILGTLVLFILLVITSRLGNRHRGGSTYTSYDSAWGSSYSSSDYSSSSSSDSSFDGGGGGDSGGGGSDSSW